MTVTHTQVLPGVQLTAVHTNKFKSSYLSVCFFTPLERGHAAANALLPMVLRRGCRRCPDMQSIAAALDELYGGVVEPLITKKGESQCVGFAASFLDDAYALNGEDILLPAARLLGELLLDPDTRDGVFRNDYVEGERANLIDQIRAQRNDKRRYSMLRLAQEMCPEEAYGVDKLGDESSAAAITPASLWQRYEQLLGSAQVHIYYCGSADTQRVEQVMRQAFAGLPHSSEREQPRCEVRSKRTGDRPRLVEETLDVTQGKLAIGLRTGGISVWQQEYPALMLLNAVFGGTSMSKLFMNVREKLSLCYFASSMLERMKGLMVISSGIEFDKYQHAKDEILAQLDACRRGDITADELEGARRIVITALQTTLDSQSRMADYWLGQAAAGLTQSPEQLAGQLEQVTVEQVTRAANRLELDTIYFLKGKEGA